MEKLRALFGISIIDDEAQAAYVDAVMYEYEEPDAPFPQYEGFVGDPYHSLSPSASPPVAGRLENLYENTADTNAQREPDSDIDTNIFNNDEPAFDFVEELPPYVYRGRHVATRYGGNGFMLVNRLLHWRYSGAYSRETRSWTDSLEPSDVLNVYEKEAQKNFTGFPSPSILHDTNAGMSLNPGYWILYVRYDSAFFKTCEVLLERNGMMMAALMQTGEVYGIPRELVLFLCGGNDRFIACERQRAKDLHTGEISDKRLHHQIAEWYAMPLWLYVLWCQCEKTHHRIGRLEGFIRSTKESVLQAQNVHVDAPDDKKQALVSALNTLETAINDIKRRAMPMFDSALHNYADTNSDTYSIVQIDDNEYGEPT